MAVKTVNRIYSNFRGVDFSNSEVNLYRSPDSVNMWKNYDDGEGIETRPGMELLGEFGSQIFGLFFYKVQNTLKVLVHAGTKLYLWTNYPNSPVTKTELFSGMNIINSQSFVFNSVLFIKDGINYLEYDGNTCQNVVGTIPMTRIGTTPDGAIYKDDVDYVYQDVNCLTNLRKNGFVADGISTEYHLDATGLDPASTYIMKATVNGTEKLESVDFSVDRTNGVVTFNIAPPAPTEDGDSNVIITFSKTNSTLMNRIKNCTLLTEFDNRIFFSGNKDYPNAVFHSELEDPRYISDVAYSEVGLDIAPVKAMIPGNDVLWVFKETIQNNSNAYYLTPTIDSQYGKVYPSVVGNISTGCVSTGVNFNDDICFFSVKGLEAIGKNLGNDQILDHRSSLVDSKLISDEDYKNIKLAEYRGYLMCLVDSKIFLADSRQLFERTAGKAEYEWFYWELPNSINYITEYQNDLYLANANGEIYILDGTKDDTAEIVVGKNKFDKNNANNFNGYPDSDSGIVSYENGKAIYIEIEGGKTYTVSKTGSIRLRLATTLTEPTSNTPIIDFVNADRTASGTIETSENAKYLFVYYYLTSDNNEGTQNDVLNTLQIEEGEEATEYEPYQETQVILDIQSKWTTIKDTFEYDSYRKITNKRGGTADVKIMNNDAITLKTKTEIRDNTIGTYSDTKGYIVYRVKEKKFKWIQLEFSSNKPFGLFSCTIEAFIGGYVKR